MAALSHDERMAALTLAEVYPHYVTKAEKKGCLLYTSDAADD